MTEAKCMDEDWDLLCSFFPSAWRRLAISEGALKGLRKDKDEENLLRTLLLHIGCGHSLRETVVRARKANLAELSDVALLKRLRKSEQWLHRLCLELFQERGIEGAQGLPGRFGRLRLTDASIIKEPGKTGSSFRLHYSLQLPSLLCDFLELTPGKGAGTGESLTRLKASPGDHILADRGYSNAKGFHHLVTQGADLTVRLCPSNIRIFKPDKNTFALDEKLSGIHTPMQSAEWAVWVADRRNEHIVPGRLCVLRKSEAAIEQSKKKLKKRAQKSGEEIRPETWFRCAFVMVFTTVDSARLSTVETLDLYRLRWQIELVFKRFKQVANLGHLPKHDEASSRAWLYGKLFVALLTEKIVSHAERFSPWGYPIREVPRHAGTLPRTQ
jgi:hypothetical protein